MWNSLTCDTLKLTILSLDCEGLTWVYLHQDYLRRGKKGNSAPFRKHSNENEAVSLTLAPVTTEISCMHADLSKLCKLA